MAAARWVFGDRNSGLKIALFGIKIGADKFVKFGQKRRSIRQLSDVLGSKFRSINSGLETNDFGVYFLIDFEPN